MAESPIQPDTLLRLTRLARSNLGFLRNARYLEQRTCDVCATPVDGYLRCYPCHQHAQSGLPISDRVGMVVYGIRSQQSGYTMLAYKGRRGVEVQREDQNRVALMALVSVGRHVSCVELLTGLPVTGWATVPSLPRRPGLHPLNAMVRHVMPGEEIVLLATDDAPNPRSLAESHYRVDPPIRPVGHVLLLDDTWTSGGHAQSAAVALHMAGAAQVSTLVLARWLDPSFPATRPFLRTLAAPDFDPMVCPWTGAACS